MISANFIIKDAAYNNDDAIYNAIHYITHNHTCPLFCYGIWPPTEENIIHKFETLRADLSTFYSKTPCQQKLQLSIPIEISILFGNSEHPFPERKNMPFRSRVQPFI